MKIDINTDRDHAVSLARRSLDYGEVIGLPTETVYGLAADATNEAAVRRIFELKGRPAHNPLICHCADLEMVRNYAILDPQSERLARAFWPGPLTMVLRKVPQSRLPDVTTAGLGTVAIRVPEGFSRDVIAALGRPVAAPSANISGKVSATQARHVEDDFGTAVEKVFDGGKTTIGIESTILMMVDGGAKLLRPGGLSLEAIESLLGFEVEGVGQQEAIIAPGMLLSHYAPRAAVRLNASSFADDEAFIAFGSHSGGCRTDRVFNLSPSADLNEAASNLYTMLKLADATGAGVIAIAPIPVVGLGVAINDRLRRAAAPRG